MSKSCLIDGCARKPFARGWCGAHWRRWRLYGDPLKGGTFNGEPMRFYVETVLNHDEDRCLTWPYATDEDGNAKMYVNGKLQYVARLVCLEVRGEPPTPKHEAAHSCGKAYQSCVAKRHLRWATKKENEADKLIHGTLTRGGKNAVPIDPTARRLRNRRKTPASREPMITAQETT